MTLSADLQERYTTEAHVDWVHAFELSHPQADTVYLVGHTEQIEGDVDGSIQLFEPVPVKLTPVSNDDTGRQEMAIIFGGIGLEAKDFLDTAYTDATEPVTMRYSVFILGDTTAQIDPWISFYFTDIQVGTNFASGKATRADIINRRFPTEVYKVTKFPGLRRQ